MICTNCKIDRLITDFGNNQKICYHCMYRIKLEKSKEKRDKGDNLCRICGEVVLHRKNIKKRQRTVFCSAECASEGHKKQIKNHWTRRIREEKLLWKTNLI